MPRDTALRLGFNAPVDLDSLTLQTFEVFGRWSGVHTGIMTYGPWSGQAARAFRSAKAA